MNLYRHFDLLLHQSDPPEPQMLRRVVGYTRGGLLKTQYINRHLIRKIYRDDTSAFRLAEDVLPWTKDLRPDDMGLIEGTAQAEWKRVNEWNASHPIGTQVYTTSMDGGFYAVTTHPAFMTRGAMGMVHLKPGGNWWLEFVVVASPIENKAVGEYGPELFIPKEMRTK